MTTSGEATRIAVIDDEALLRKGLVLMLDGAEGIDVVGEASNGKMAIEVIQRKRPDVVLMDIRMPVMTGIEAVATLRELGIDVPVIMLTAFDTDAFILRSLEAGAVGFLLKTTAPEALVRSIKAAAAGQQLLSAEVLSKLVGMAGHGRDGGIGGGSAASDGGGEPVTAKTGAGFEGSPAARRLDVLSPREKELALLIAQGMGNAEIAEKLYISIPTVKTHVARILEKLQVSNRVQIAIAVVRD
ncbi:response regulator [Corynebacterium sp. HMSC28B08]|uniref:response regulator n=1 Tax=Corynebacterium TaxID=1716 RepID=UPI0008A3109B|nr:response regulator transcription factor [Corynebacterium sp. HMSC28B08]OFT89280.1 DNA-binding response regulator [Corynebacterium sp. HMSC28B08]